MRHLLLAIALALFGLAACHESELEPQVPEQVWQDRPVETAYALAPVPAVIDPAPVPRDRPRSISLGYVGDAPLTETPAAPPHWPYVQEPFHYIDGYPTPYAYPPAPAPYGRRYVRRY